MNGTPDDTPYCRLYFTTGESRADIQAALDEEVARQFPFIQVHAPVYKNHAYVSRRSGEAYCAVEHSQWTAEVDTEQNSPETFEAFQLGLIAVILRLRKRGCIVTASCDFEERVASETGWNWSTATPDPPSQF